ncbi:MAG: hypothetical protein Q8P28_07105 [Deltaproteobacteria bacterium]|nr:hypothetical protein [Deltaproteobacteria bacterium]
MAKHSGSFNYFYLNILCGFFLGVIIISLFPSSSFATPAFARKYDLSCASCHTKPPRLNAFGEAFHMAGFQIPTVQEGEIKKKRHIGRIMSETEFLNIFSVRTTGDFIQSFSGGQKNESAMALPQSVELYLAGNFTDAIGYFFELEHESRAIEGLAGGRFEETSRFGIGKEFFFIFDLPALFKSASPDMADSGGPMGHSGGAMIMGPMVMAGKIDPSTNFSYPTNRQFILNVPGRVRVDSGIVERFGLTPYAFAVKFFGIKTTEGNSVEVTREVLYNTPGDFGIDLHVMVENLIVQAGVMQGGLQAGNSDVNQKKDPYMMMRLNFGQEAYISGSLSGLVYWGNDTAMVDTSLVNWLRYGFSGNLKYKYLDLYGAIIWDNIRNLPAGISSPFDSTAYGFTIEGDYLATDRWLLSLRYDQLKAGGFISQKTDGKTIAAQARFYIRDNFSFYLRDSFNLEGVNDNALRNFQNFVTLGVDFHF